MRIGDPDKPSDHNHPSLTHDYPDPLCECGCGWPESLHHDRAS